MKNLIIIFFLPVFTYSQIIESTLTTSWSIDDVQEMYSDFGVPDFAGETNYAVDGYSVIYMTPNENGDLVEASGAIYLPVDVDPLCAVPILSWQHGTMVNNSSAPSQVVSNMFSGGNIIGVVGASHGYVVFMSDYLGLGLASSGFHNYCHSDTEASAVIDLIIHGKEFANTQGLTTNNQLFLMGYSQGGHATMAAVREIEANWPDLEVTSSCPMAGPYSMSDVQADMVNSVYPNPGYFPYVAFAYNHIYDLYDDPSEILKPGFDNLYNMYTGSNSMDEINAEIWSIAQDMYGIDAASFTPLDMIQEDYYYDYQNNENHPFQLALEDNDLLDFIPNSSMRLIHCVGDNDVAYENSVMAYNVFNEFATEELFLIDGGNFNHSECAPPAIIQAKLFFDTKANFCNVISVSEFMQENKIISVFDVFGRPVSSSSSNDLTITIYSDGSVKKSIVNF